MCLYEFLVKLISNFMDFFCVVYNLLSFTQTLLKWNNLDAYVWNSAFILYPTSEMMEIWGNNTIC